MTPNALTPSRRSAGSDPAVLVVGAGQSMKDAIQAALTTRHIFSHAVSADAAVECVRAAAPDLVLLVGDAAVDGGVAILRGLGSSPMTSVVPVAILADEVGLADRLTAFRHGATAVIPKSASVDAIAAEVERLVREIPDRGGAALGNVGEATLRELVDTLSRELRTGILSVRGPGKEEDDAVRLVLGGGKPVAEAIDDFVRRLQSHVVHAEPLRYEFEERAGGTLQLLDAETLLGDAPPSKVDGLRIVLVDENASRADTVAQELRARGASVVVTDPAPTDMHFARLRQLDPAIVMIGERTLHGGGYSLLRRMRHDARLRWASLFIVRWDELWSEDAAIPRLDALAGTLMDLNEPELSLQERAKSEASFDVRLETMGPARLVRALAGCGETVRATVYNPRVAIQVDVAQGTVVSSSGYVHADSAEPFEGVQALSALLVLSSGRVHVEREEHVGSPNVMCTDDVAFSMADAVAPPIAPSLPPPGATLTGSPPPTTGDVARGMSRRSGVVLRGLGAVSLLGAAGLAVWYAGLLPWSSARRGPKDTARPASPAVPAASSGSAPAAAVSVMPRSSVSTPPGTAAPPPAAPAAPLLPEGIVRETTVATPSCEKLAGKLGSITGDDAKVESAAAMRQARHQLVRGDLEAAQRALCRACRLTPEDASSVSSLVRVLLMRRDGEQAVLWARRVLESSPANRNIRALLGDALARTGDVAGAIREWLAAARVQQDDLLSVQKLARQHVQIAAGAMKRSEHSRAERYYRRAVYLHRTNVRAVEGLSRALVWLKDYQAAEAWARRALDLSPRNPASLTLQGDALAGQGKLKEAEKSYEAALEAAPGSTLARRGLRRVQAKASR